MNKKGNMAFLSAFAISFIVAGLYLSLGTELTSSMQAFYYTDVYGDVLISNTTDVPQNSLVTHFALNDNASSTLVINTIVGGSNATSTRNTVLLSNESVVSTALFFNATEEDYIITGSNTALNYSWEDEFSYSFYINLQGEMAEGIIMGDIETWTTGSPGWVLKVLETGHLAMYWLDAGTLVANLTTTNALVNDTWYSVVYTNTVDYAGGVGAFYINGTLHPTDNKQWNLTMVEGNSSYNAVNLTIGYAGDEAAVFFNGYLDEVKFYDETIVLSDTIVLADALTNASWSDYDYADVLVYENQLVSTTYSNGYAYNITDKAQEGLYAVANRLPLIGLIVGIVLVIGYVKMVQ